MTLADRSCRPTDGATTKLEGTALERLTGALPLWDATDGHLRRSVKFGSFPTVIQFIVRLADIAEAEQHHPDFTVHYDRIDIDIWTHTIGGLSENDCILAAKLDRLVETMGPGGA